MLINDDNLLNYLDKMHTNINIKLKDLQSRKKKPKFFDNDSLLDLCSQNSHNPIIITKMPNNIDFSPDSPDFDELNAEIIKRKKELTEIINSFKNNQRHSDSDKAENRRTNEYYKQLENYENQLALINANGTKNIKII
jgi:hypothetical protein